MDELHKNLPIVIIILKFNENKRAESLVTILFVLPPL